MSEITQLSKSDITPEEYYTQFLQRVVTAVAAIGGAVWRVGDTGGLTLQCQVNLRETGLAGDNDKEKLMEHSRLLYKGMRHPEGLIVTPYSSSQEEEGTVGNPTGCLILLAPLATEVETVGLVEIFQRPDVPAATQNGYVHFIMQMCELAVEFIRTHQLKHFADRQLLWNRVEEYTRTIHETLDPRATAFTIANEGRRLIGCDRVSVAIRYGSKCRVVAVSGQDVFDKRSNVIRLLNRLATAVVSVEEPLWYTGDTSNLAPQVEKIIDEYVDESHSKAVIVIPIIEPMREEDKEDFKKRQDKKRKPIGAIIVEQIENSAIQTTLRQRVDVVVKHACVALSNSLEHNSLFLMPVWRAIGRWSWVVKARTLPKTILVGIVLITLLALLFVFPYKFEVEAEGKLTPVSKCQVFANVDGDVHEVLVRHGDLVKGPRYPSWIKYEKGLPVPYAMVEGKLTHFDLEKYLEQPGTPLVRLRNVDLDTALVKLRGDIDRTRQELNAVSRLLSREKTLTVEDRLRQQGRQSELQGQLAAFEAELALVLKKQSYLVVTSPCGGQIITFDVREKLMNRPVQRGQALMEVANTDGDWEVELYVPEKRIGLIREATLQFQEEHPEGLPVTYILASHPDQKLKGTIKEIHKTAEVRGERGNTVLIKVKIDKESLIADAKKGEEIKLNIGAGVTGKIYCGKRPIGYVWFHDLIAFVQQKILFRWF